MKYLFLLVTILGMLSTTVQAQSDITISISEELKEGNQYVKVSIKNNTDSQKTLFARASWGGGEGDYLDFPLSYIRLIGNPNTQDMIETPKLIISNDIVIGQITRTNSYVNLEANGSHDMYYKLYGEDWGPFRTFSDKQKSKIKTLQAKLVLAYFDVADEKGHKIELKSNIITLQ